MRVRKKKQPLKEKRSDCILKHLISTPAIRAVELYYHTASSFIREGGTDKALYYGIALFLLVLSQIFIFQKQTVNPCCFVFNQA